MNLIFKYIAPINFFPPKRYEYETSQIKCDCANFFL